MDSYTHNTKPHKPNSSGFRHEATSPTDLFSSAQVLAGAAMSAFRHESSKVNKSEAATAADNLLHAASQYGNSALSFTELVESGKETKIIWPLGRTFAFFLITFLLLCEKGLDYKVVCEKWRDKSLSLITHDVHKIKPNKIKFFQF